MLCCCGKPQEIEDEDGGSGVGVKRMDGTNTSKQASRHVRAQDPNSRALDYLETVVTRTERNNEAMPEFNTVELQV